jgi:hypothetical protein
MIFLGLITASTLWLNNFSADTGIWIPDRRNPVSISYLCTDSDSLGYVHLAGNPQDVGRSSAWFHVGQIPELTARSCISLRVKGNDSLVTIRMAFKRLGTKPYYYLRKCVRVSREWQKIRIPLKDAKPLWASNYPESLVPGLSPDFFLFVENGEPGHFCVTIDRIEILTE